MRSIGCRPDRLHHNETHHLPCSSASCSCDTSKTDDNSLPAFLAGSITSRTENTLDRHRVSSVLLRSDFCDFGFASARALLNATFQAHELNVATGPRTFGIFALAMSANSAVSGFPAQHTSMLRDVIVKKSCSFIGRHIAEPSINLISAPVVSVLRAMTTGINCTHLTSRVLFSTL